MNGFNAHILENIARKLDVDSFQIVREYFSSAVILNGFMGFNKIKLEQKEL